MIASTKISHNWMVFCSRNRASSITRIQAALAEVHMSSQNRRREVSLRVDCTSRTTRFELNRKCGLSMGKCTMSTDSRDVIGSAMRAVRTTLLEAYSPWIDMYVPYADITFSDRMLTAASAIATVDYFKETIVDFTLSISVLTATLRSILYVRQNDTTKTQV